MSHPASRPAALLTAALLSAGLMLAPLPARSAAGEAAIGELFDYADILGRAAACNVDVRWPSRLVSEWIDDVFVKGSAEQQRLLAAFVEHMLANAALQRNDPAARSCADIARTVQSYAWPVPAL